MFGKNILEIYKQKFVEQGGDYEDVKTYRMQAVKEHMTSSFSDRIDFTLYDKLKGNIFFSIAMSAIEAVEVVRQELGSVKGVTDAALQLRSKILSIQNERTAGEITVENLKSIAPEIPIELETFFQISHVW